MTAAPEITLTDADTDALTYYLVDAASIDLACRAAKVSPQRFNEVVFPAIVPALRGNGVGYKRFANAKTIVDGDRLRLDYEIRLGQLQRQHQMCVDAYRRTDEYAQRQVANHAAQKDAEPLRQKALTGDIRFLQLARSIRHEMDILEKKLEERLELLHSWQERGESRNKSAPPAQAKTPPQPSPTPLSPPQPNPTKVANDPSNKAVSEPQPPVPAETDSQFSAQLLKPKTESNPLLLREDLLAALGASQIPGIDPPPRKADKFAQSKVA